MPLWYLLCMKEIPIPESMQSIIPDDTSIIFFEILVGELAIELIRVSSLHTPTALNSSLGLISAVLVGNIAIETGICHKDSLKKIAKLLGRHPSTIAHEIKENRTFIPIEFMPQKVINAFVAGEDKHFFKHFGIDLSGSFIG